MANNKVAGNIALLTLGSIAWAKPAANEVKSLARDGRCAPQKFVINP